MRHSILLVSVMMVIGCPGKAPEAPVVPAVCTDITEDRDAEDHCSVDKADCETTLSRILTDSHRNRCVVPPCLGYSAGVTCEPTGEECELGSGEIGQRFTTKESIRCR